MFRSNKRQIAGLCLDVFVSFFSFSLLLTISRLVLLFKQMVVLEKGKVFAYTLTTQ